MHVLQQQQDHGRQPQDQGRQQNSGYKSVSDRLHKSRQQEPVWKPGSGRLDHLVPGRQPFMDPVNLEQDLALKNQVQILLGQINVYFQLYSKIFFFMNLT